MDTGEAEDQWADHVERLAFRQRLDVFLPSRDAGRALAMDALRTGVSLKSVVQVASDVATYADEAMDIVREDFRPNLHCRKACTYCCRKPGVLIAIPELLRVLAHVGEHFDAEAVAALRERSNHYASQVGARSVNQRWAESVPCPLLVDDLCSVYEARPLVCRGYNSTDVDACERAHRDPDVLLPTFAPIKDVTDGATVGMVQHLRDAGLSDAMVDLGTALHIVLSAGDDCAEAIVRGEQDLTRAERPSWVSDLWTLVSETARRVGVPV
jgi:Fe-S-cluster containining protein